jgi:hypothetical protein
MKATSRRARERPPPFWTPPAKVIPTRTAIPMEPQPALPFTVEPLPAPPTPALPAFGDPLYAAAEARLAAVFEQARVCESHGIAHARDVARLTGGALACDPAPTYDDQVDALLAAVLHDGDDRKFFSEHQDFENARAILAEIGLEAGRAARVVRMISWVSASKNGDRIPPEAAERPWMLYPRHADRLATTGWTGVYRCWKYNDGIGRPLYTAATPRAVDEEDLWGRLATTERYAAYCGDSDSMIDHYYDKLLRLGQGPYLNTFLAAEAERRARPLVEVALLFGRTGGLPASLFDLARAAAEKECGA